VIQHQHDARADDEGFNYVYNNFYSLKKSGSDVGAPKGNYLEHAFYFIANLKLNHYMRNTKNAGEPSPSLLLRNCSKHRDYFE